MKSYTALPEGYTEIMSVDLQKNKRQALIVNGAALVIAALMAIVGVLIRPINLLSIYDDMPRLIIMLLVAGLGSIAYIFLHELTHGVVMYAYSRVRPTYGFTGIYAYAGSTAYFGKIPYIVIALAPVVLLGAVLLALNLTLPSYLFWPIYFIQITNISGAAGDLYVTLRFLALPSDILVNDVGVSMTVYSKAED